jgi:hypothetical protein
MARVETWITVLGLTWWPSSTWEHGDTGSGLVFVHCYVQSFLPSLLLIVQYSDCRLPSSQTEVTLGLLTIELLVGKFCGKITWKSQSDPA